MTFWKDHSCQSAGPKAQSFYGSAASEMRLLLLQRGFSAKLVGLYSIEMVVPEGTSGLVLISGEYAKYRFLFPLGEKKSVLFLDLG